MNVMPPSPSDVTMIECGSGPEEATQGNALQDLAQLYELRHQERYAEADRERLARQTITSPHHQQRDVSRRWHIVADV